MELIHALFAVLVGATVVEGSASGQQELRVSKPVWAHHFDGRIIDISPEMPGDCLAVLTETDVSVFNYRGRRQWRRTFARMGRPFTASRVALASSCDWIAVIGDASYRHLWVFRRDGSDAYFGFQGETPLGVAIAPSDGLIAVSTGGRRVHFIQSSADGLTRRRTARSGNVVRGVACSADGAFLDLTHGYGHGLLETAGEGGWIEPGGVCWMSVASSRSWSVAACLPPHFSSFGHVSARTANGSVLWRKGLYGAQAVLARNGSIAALLGQPGEMAEHAATEDHAHLYVVNRKGHVTTTVPMPNQRLIGVKDDGSAILVRDRRAATVTWYSSQGRRVRSAALATDYRQITARRDLGYLFAWDQNTLEVFSTASRR